MGRLILIRHGESECNATRCFASSPDAVLTERGRVQALDAAVRIGAEFRPSLVVASPYRRAHETARIIAELLSLSVEVESEIREQQLGLLVGKPYESVRQFPDFDPLRSWLFRPPDGESQDDVRRRSGPALDRLMLRFSDSDVVVVSHGGVMRALWAHVTGRWDDAQIPANCGIVTIEHQNRRYTAAPLIAGDADPAWRASLEPRRSIVEKIATGRILQA